MKAFLDTSVLVAVFYADHEHHPPGIDLFAYAKSADVIDMATACTAGIVRNHPFVDGNKRTGFVAGILFLELVATGSAPARKARSRRSWNWRPATSMKQVTNGDRRTRGGLKFRPAHDPSEQVI